MKWVAFQGTAVPEEERMGLHHSNFSNVRSFLANLWHNELKVSSLFLVGRKWRRDIKEASDSDATAIRQRIKRRRTSKMLTMDTTRFCAVS
jgi:hypothetical protein